MRRVRLRGDGRRAEREAAYRELPGFEPVSSGADLLDVFGGDADDLAEVAAALTEGETAVVHAPLLEWAPELLSLHTEHEERLVVVRPGRWDRRIEALRTELDAGEMGPLAAIRVVRLASPAVSRAELEWWALDALVALGGAVARVFRQRTALPGESVEQALSVVRFGSGAIGYAEASNAYPPAARQTLIEVTSENGMLEYDSLTAPNRFFGERLEVLAEAYVEPPLQRMLGRLLAEPKSDSGMLLALAAAAWGVAGQPEAVEV